MKSFRDVFRCAYSLIVVSFVMISLHANAQFTPRTAGRDDDVRHEQWFKRGRAAIGTNSAAGLRLRALQTRLLNRQLRAKLACTGAVSTSSAGWQSLGPAPLASDATGQGWQDYGPVSGRVTAVVVDPADSTGNTVYLGGAYGGIWRSLNATSGSYGNASGVTWTPLTDDQPTLAVGAIALQPGNITGSLSNLILVGTGEANSSGDSYYGLGFLRSTDHGSTWSLITSADSGTHPLKGLAVSKIVFSSSQPSTVVAGVGFSVPGEIEGADDLVTTPHGIYYSTDAGASWHLATVQDSGLDIATDSPRGIVYNPTSGKFYASIRRHGFYSSSDGITWSRLSGQPGGTLLATANCPANPASAGCPIVRGELAVTPGRNEMYAWFTDFDAAAMPNDIDRGIWKSLDGGSTWTAVSTAAIDSCGDLVGGCGTENGEYNLALVSVPNGSATDLYAGAINLFKCTVSGSNPDCTNTPFLNLTHVYGCPPYFGSTAHVHPGQHSIDFMRINGNSQSVMYFGNDGGIYRALDGYSGLTTGACGGSNRFDSLNGTLGSLTQFISLAEDSGNSAVLLGGSHGVGSPATAAAASSAGWISVNNADGGFVAIDPRSPSTWFTSHPDVGGGNLGIEQCSLGINCHAQDFASNLVVSSYDVNGDDGAFHFPFLLDPQDASQMLVGTCRVWLGPSGGGSFIPLSHNFETGTATTCTGSETNTVSAIAAGGPKTTFNNSKVIYATTGGFGSLTNLLGLPSGGRVFATTDSATTLMSDVTGSINPIHYPISSVVVDPSDASGQTAFVTVMGFGTPHVYKTSNAGVSWSDFSGSGATQIPDAPANAVVVDGSAGMVYVGTDVGVFGSVTSSPNWLEVGPTSGAGMLPNAAVIDLKLFVTSGLLRAATYGRGVWQINLVPGFQINISNSSQTTFPSQQATFNGRAVAQGGYSSSVALSCKTGSTPPPATCNAIPASLTPTSGGTTFQIKGADAVGDYLFNVHGAGSDTNHLTADQPATLHVVDFSLGPPTPSSVTANRPNSSNAANFVVSGSGAFSQSVTLTCSGLPSGATCNFSPSSAVSPMAGSPVTVSLTISTKSATATGSYSVTISGSTTNPAATRNQSITLAVTALPDYVIAISNSPQSAFANQTATFFGKLTAANGYGSAVSLSCGTGAPPTCTPNPSSVTPNASGAPFSVNIGSNAAQNFSFDIVATGSDSAHITHSSTVAFTSLLDIHVAATNSPQTVHPGEAANFSLNVSPIGGMFQNVVTLQYSGCPAQSSCSITPGSIPAGSGTTLVTLNVSTAGPASPGGMSRRQAALLWLSIPLLGLIMPIAFRVGRNSFGLALVLITVVSLGLLEACGGGASTGGGTIAPPSEVQVAVTPSAISIPVGSTLRFSATVTGTTNTKVIWKVNNTTGGNATVGKIDGYGLYTAPAAVPNPAAVSVTAVSQADQLKSDSADVTIVAAPVAVSIVPRSASVFTNGTQLFTATVTGTSNKQVTWNVNGTVGGNSISGSIDASGLYHAPAAVPNPAAVNIGAVSVVDNSKSSSAIATILPSTPIGTYTLTVTANSGSLTRAANISLNVAP